MDYKYRLFVFIPVVLSLLSVNTLKENLERISDAKVGERISDAKVGRDDIFRLFPKKVLTIFFNLLFHFGFLLQFISIVKRKINSNIERQKCKGHEK